MSEKGWDGTGGQDEQAFGHSRCGFGAKIHGAARGLRLPVELILTPGQAADISQAKTLIEESPVAVVVAEKGHDSKAIVEAIEAKGAEAVIPSLKNRAEPRDYDRNRDKDRSSTMRYAPPAPPLSAPLSLFQYDASILPIRYPNPP